MPIQTRRVFLTLLHLTTAAPLSALAADLNLPGAWTATVYIPGTGSNSASLTLEQKGDSLSGRITNSFGRESEITGTVIGTQIQLSYTSAIIRVRTDSGDKPLVLNFVGLASNEEIDVKATTPVGEATLRAKRK